MNEEQKAQANGWFAKAGEDEQSIQAILSGNGAPSTACFLAQQMAEKYLKGLLVRNGVTFRKVHDLLQLESLMLQKVPEVAEIHEELIRLNRYYITTRYPGDFPEFTLHMAHEAQTDAQRVKEAVLQLAHK